MGPISSCGFPLGREPWVPLGFPAYLKALSGSQQCLPALRLVVLGLGAILIPPVTQNGTEFPQVVLEGVSPSDIRLSTLFAQQQPRICLGTKHPLGARPGNHKLGPLEVRWDSRVVKERPSSLSAPY